MSKKTLNLLALMFCIGFNSLFAQTKPEAKKEIKFGKISPSEFETKASGRDSSAAAIKIFDVGDCYFEISSTTGSFVYVFERHVRYKILTKNGYDYANYKIGLHKNSGSSKESLDAMDGATYNMVDGKMITSKLSRDSKFTEETTKNYSIQKFALPNVKENSIIEFKYKIRSDFIFNLRGWGFQSEIPTLYSEYNVTIPQYLSYKIDVNGYNKINHSLHESINASYAPGIESNADHDKYVLENVPALKDEPFITTLDDYRPQIEFELRGTNYPNDIYRDYNGTWPKIVASLVDDENFGKFINKNSYAKTTLPLILKGEKDTLAATKLIFDYVKKNLKWNKNFNLYSSETNPKVIFDKKTGNSADINLCLINLLKEAKIDVYPVLLSTRENGKHPGYPVISKFDNVIAVMEVANKTYFLDATNKDMQVGMVQFENLTHQGFLMNMKTVEGRWISTETEFAEDKIFVYNLTLGKDNKLTGTINEYNVGYGALKAREKYRVENTEAEYLKAFKKNKPGLELSNYKIDNLDSLDNSLIESMDVIIEDNVEEAGNMVYFTPLLFEKTKENPFKREERLFPVDFAHPIKESYRITVSFPEDYEVDKLPKSIAYKLPDGGGTFTITYLNEGKTLMVRSVINLNKSVYSADEYFSLKELFKAVVEKQAEQIVFKKKA